jgi:holin-like protein
MRQFCIIILISFTGEFLSNIIPLPIPGSIYGLVIMLSILRLKSLNQIQDTAEFLLDIMILMLIPTAVGLIESWRSLKEILLPVAIITVVTSVLVMVVTGWVTQLFVWKRGLENE